jgi:uncharacterized protein
MMFERKYVRRAGLGALLLGLALSAAVAGPKEDTEEAEKEFARGNLIVALKLWKKAAEQGYAPAQTRMGDMLDKSEDDVDAVGWYKKAAAQGDAAGEFGLGGMYAKGEGVKKDFELARKYIGSAAEKGNLQAMLVMRDMYKNGSMDVAIDLAKSEEWQVKLKPLLPEDTSPPAPPPEPKVRKRR